MVTFESKFTDFSGSIPGQFSLELVLLSKVVLYCALILRLSWTRYRCVRLDLGRLQEEFLFVSLAEGILGLNSRGRGSCREMGSYPVLASAAKPLVDPTFFICLGYLVMRASSTN